MKKAKKRAASLAILLYLLLNGLGLGLLKVYVTCHNTMNHEQLVMARLESERTLTLAGAEVPLPDLMPDPDLNAFLLLPEPVQAALRILTLCEGYAPL